MRTSILILCFSVICCYHSSAQTTSAKKNAQVVQPIEQHEDPVPASTTATLVSGARHAEIREVPLENKTEATPVKNEIISSEKKPR